MIKILAKVINIDVNPFKENSNYYIKHGEMQAYLKCVPLDELSNEIDLDNNCQYLNVPLPLEGKFKENSFSVISTYVDNISKLSIEDSNIIKIWHLGKADIVVDYRNISKVHNFGYTDKNFRKLNSPVWKDFTERTLLKYDHECVFCHLIFKNNLHTATNLHHLRENGKGTSSNIDYEKPDIKDVIPVCWKHHRELHSRFNGDVKAYIKYLKDIENNTKII